jgi:protein AbiQ
MKTLKLYYLDEDYINFLRQFDSKVFYNKNQTRPYVGVVYTFDNLNYFAPLSSPKPKHLKMNNKAIDIFKIDDGKLGIVNINNMIPVPIECLNEVLPLIKNDEKYRHLVENQTTFINNNKQRLFKKIKRFVLQYRKGYLPINIKNRCCNFVLLEEKYKDYIRVDSSNKV